MKIFFATDIHGSNICFKKLLSAYKHYEADVVILGGDMNGKLAVPIFKLGNGRYEYKKGQEKFVLKSQELDEAINRLGDEGLYPYVTDEFEIQSYQGNKEKAEKIYENLVTERLMQWIELADKKLNSENRKLYVCPGNDDAYFIDEILPKSSSIINLENAVFDLTEEFQIVSTGHSNRTRWNTPREIEENELEDILENLVQKVDKNKTIIYNIHVPPFNTKLDDCVELDNELNPRKSLGQDLKEHVGSIAVRKIIEKNQPLLGLFGHVHESKGDDRIGRTLCLNPGSIYQEGSLNGYLITIEKNRIIAYQPTSG